MNKNKGFIGIGLILAIILGIVVIGGGAYYLGNKNSNQEVKVEENNLPTNEDQNLPVDNTQQVKCDSNSIPSITVLSPNGGETYTAGQKITVKWSSCNFPSNANGVNITVAWTGNLEALSFPVANGTPNDGQELITLPSQEKIKDFYTNTFVVHVQMNIPGQNLTINGDDSDNTFTINSATISTSQKCIDTATSLLPAYILKQGNYLDFKLNKVNFFALRSDASGAQYFTGNPTNDACMVNVSYSVKLKAGAINAGNGQESSDGWIINKSGYATVDKNSNGYYISSMGTGY